MELVCSGHHSALFLACSSGCFDTHLGLLSYQFLLDNGFVLLVLQLRSRRKSKSRMGMERVMGLSVDQKLELVQKELEDTKDEIRHMRANAERDLQHHEVDLPVGRPPWAPRFCLGKKYL